MENVYLMRNISTIFIILILLTSFRTRMWFIWSVTKEFWNSIRCVMTVRVRKIFILYVCQFLPKEHRLQTFYIEFKCHNDSVKAQNTDRESYEGNMRVSVSDSPGQVWNPDRFKLSHLLFVNSLAVLFKM